MPSIYEKSTRELFHEFVNSFVPPPPEGFGLIERKPLAEGGHFTRQEILAWFQENYPKIKRATVNAHLVVMSTNSPSRVHHKPRPNGADDLLFQIDRSRFRLYSRDSDSPPIYPQHENPPTDEDIDEEDTSELQLQELRTLNSSSTNSRSRSNG